MNGSSRAALEIVTGYRVFHSATARIVGPAFIGHGGVNEENASVLVPAALADDTRVGESALLARGDDLTGIPLRRESMWPTD